MHRVLSWVLHKHWSRAQSHPSALIEYVVVDVEGVFGAEILVLTHQMRYNARCIARIPDKFVPRGSLTKIMPKLVRVLHNTRGLIASSWQQIHTWIVDL